MGYMQGLKKRKMDLVGLSPEKPASVAGFTMTNKTSQLTLIDQAPLLKKAGKMKATVVNSSVANSCTGTQGFRRCLHHAGVDR